jgi:integration host factor subunit beta
MTKADLVEQIAQGTGLSKKDTGVVVDLILENISRALCEGDKVELRGFGSFKVKERRSRKARNPRTGDAVDVPSKLVPYFKASNELKALVDGGEPEDVPAPPGGPATPEAPGGGTLA